MNQKKIERDLKEKTKELFGGSFDFRVDPNLLQELVIERMQKCRMRVDYASTRSLLARKKHFWGSSFRLRGRGEGVFSKSGLAACFRSYQLV